MRPIIYENVQSFNKALNLFGKKKQVMMNKCLAGISFVLLKSLEMSQILAFAK